ncbi:MAG: glutamine amidotransferase [Bryobacteraceae bacterium]
MFEFLFGHPRSVYSKGEIVLLGGWPWWTWLLLTVAGAAALGWFLRQRVREAAPGMRGIRPWVIWALQSTMLAAVLLLLWQPALLVSTLKPQQNVVAVVVDDSQSMLLEDTGDGTRLNQVKAALGNGVLDRLGDRFQLRVYRAGNDAHRIRKLDQLTGEAPATHLGDVLKQVNAEMAGLPLGAVLLLTDGADNSGGVDFDTVSELRARRVPVHTVGFGREQAQRDVEIVDVQVPARVLSDSRANAAVSLAHHGLSGRVVKVTLRDSGKVLAQKQVTLKADGQVQTENILFHSGNPGARTVQVSIDKLDGEENLKNNETTRLVSVENTKPKVLYFDGEPRWEFKFIRRAMDEDKSVRLVTILRTTQNKNYIQGREGNEELADGFPVKVDELFSYQALVLGSVEAGYFTTAQQELIKNFVDRRGGGLLLLAGRAALSEGGWNRSGMSEILPVALPDRKGAFQRDPATPGLTAPGVDSLITRLVEDPAQNMERWKKLPYMADYQDIGTPKPGATTLAEMSAGGRAGLPLLVTHNYGRGRVAVLATSGTWRWQMSQPLEDKTHETFWQQLMRWLVTDTPGRVQASTPRQMLFDESKIRLTADVRDRTYLPAPDARVFATLIGPAGSGGQIELQPDPATPGSYFADYSIEKPGSFVAEILAKRGDEEIGRDVITFERKDGVAESFRTNQNRDLLTRLSTQTGGQYWTPADLKRLPEEISLSEAGVTVRETRDLWNIPAVFLLLLGLRAAEWLLRRHWGVV